MSVFNYFIPGTTCFRVLFCCAVFSLNLSLARLAYHNYQYQSDQANLTRLNESVTQYKQEMGKLPDLNLIGLYEKGLTKQRLNRTPFGGYYRLDPSQCVVYNPTNCGR